MEGRSFSAEQPSSNDAAIVPQAKAKKKLGCGGVQQGSLPVNRKGRGASWADRISLEHLFYDGSLSVQVRTSGQGIMHLVIL